MASGDILCLNCGITGILSIHNDNVAVPQDHLFKPIAHELHGYFHYRCPVCNIILRVNPMEVMEQKALNGYPNWLAKAQAKQRKGYKPIQKTIFRSSLEKLRTTSPAQLIVSIIILAVGALSLFVGLKDATADIAPRLATNAITLPSDSLLIIKHKTK